MVDWLLITAPDAFVAGWKWFLFGVVPEYYLPYLLISCLASWAILYMVAYMDGPEKRIQDIRWDGRKGVIGWIFISLIWLGSLPIMMAGVVDTYLERRKISWSEVWSVPLSQLIPAWPDWKSKRRELEDRYEAKCTAFDDLQYDLDREEERRMTTEDRLINRTRDLDIARSQLKSAEEKSSAMKQSLTRERQEYHYMEK